MEPFVGMTRLMFFTLPQLLLNGWSAMLLLLALLLVYRQYHRIAAMETELFGVAKHAAAQQTLYSLAIGTLGGVAGSAIMSLTGVGLVEVPGAPSVLLYLWLLSILLGAVNPRFLCFSYSGMILAVSHLLTGWPRMDAPSLLGLIAMLHMVEALLILTSGDSHATPISVGGRGSEPVPGFSLQRLWPVPLILPVFGTTMHGPLSMPGWWPLVEPTTTAVSTVAPFGWQLLPVVVTMGYSDLAISAPPSSRVRQSSRVLLLYSGTLLVLAVASIHFRPLVWVAALFSGLGHEAMAVLSGRLQLVGNPYLRRPPKGVAILDVLPGSVAAAAGLHSGAVLLTVDDYEVHNKEQLHEALLASPAYVRIMYRVGRQLEYCRVPRPSEGLYSFGVILLPEPGDRAMTTVKRPGFFRWSGLEK